MIILISYVQRQTKKKIDVKITKAIFFNEMTFNYAKEGKIINHLKLVRNM